MPDLGNPDECSQLNEGFTMRSQMFCAETSDTEKIVHLTGLLQHDLRREL